MLFKHDLQGAGLFLSVCKPVQVTLYYYRYRSNFRNCKPKEKEKEMNNVIKGALLSGLVVPGLGQVFLKHYLRGGFFLLVVCGCLAVFSFKLIQLSFAIISGIQKSSNAVSLSSVIDIAVQAALAMGGTTLGLLFAVLLLCWIGGTIDAYSLGRKIDLEIEHDTVEKS